MANKPLQTQSNRIIIPANKILNL